MIRLIAVVFALAVGARCNRDGGANRLACRTNTAQKARGNSQGIAYSGASETKRSSSPLARRRSQPLHLRN